MDRSPTIRRSSTTSRQSSRLGSGTRSQCLGPDELTRVVMVPSLHDYQIVVVDASRAYSLVAYGHGDRLLALVYDDHHYDTLTSIKGFLGHSYLCLVCRRGYDQGQHRSPQNKGEHCLLTRVQNHQGPPMFHSSSDAGRRRRHATARPRVL